MSWTSVSAAGCDRPGGRVLSHDTEQALATVTALVNTLPQPNRTDELSTVEELRTLLIQCRVSGFGQLGTADLAGLRALREPYREIFEAAELDTVADLVNDRMAASAARHAVRPHLTNHDGLPWHLHYGAESVALADRLNSEMAIALAHVVADGQTGRLAVCRAPNCRSVLVDLTRNRSKLYCDARTCGNRRHVAAFRERQRTATRP